MTRSVLLAAGVFACVVGLEMLLVDSAVLLPIDGKGPAKTFSAPDWAPWTLISVGAVSILHFGNIKGFSAGSSAAHVGRHY